MRAFGLAKGNRGGIRIVANAPRDVTSPGPNATFVQAARMCSYPVAVRELKGGKLGLHLSRPRTARQASPSSVPDACQGPGLCELPSHALCSAMLDRLAPRIFWSILLS